MEVSSKWHGPGNMRSVAMDWDTALEWDTSLTQTEPTVVGLKKKTTNFMPFFILSSYMHDKYRQLDEVAMRSSWEIEPSALCLNNNRPIELKLAYSCKTQPNWPELANFRSSSINWSKDLEDKPISTSFD